MTKYEDLSDNAQSMRFQGDEIDLQHLFANLWAGKWLILALTLLFAGGGVAYALFKPNIYQASVLLSPTNEESGIGGISGQLGGLASLAGISLGSGGSNQTIIAKQVLQSRAFLTDFIVRHDLRVPLMASEAWDLENGRWIIDPETYNGKTGEWQRDEEGESLKPTDWDTVKEFRENNLSVSEDKETGMLTLNLKSLSPVSAKEWASLLVHDLNENMRHRDVKEAEARIAYLEGKLEDTNIAGMQQVFYQLIESETRTVMLANAQDEYVFKTIDPAVVPQEKSEPNRALIGIVATMLGGMLGGVIVLARTFIFGGKYKKESA